MWSLFLRPIIYSRKVIILLQLIWKFHAGKMPVREAIDRGPEHKRDTQGWTSLMCGKHNARATARDNTEQNTHTPSPRIKINISDRAGN